MMPTASDLIEELLFEYERGLYTRDELQWKVLLELAVCEDRQVFWSNLPAWMRGEIVDHLASWNPTTNRIHFGEEYAGQADTIRRELTEWLREQVPNDKG